jgi:transcription initiation factor TFIID subunit 5
MSSSSSTTTLASIISSVLVKTGLSSSVQAELQKSTNTTNTSNNESPPSLLIKEYRTLCKWIDGSLDTFRDDIFPISFALFVHTYITLIKRNKIQDGKKFLDEYRVKFIIGHQMELLELERFSSWPADEQIEGNDLNKLHPYVSSVLTNKFIISMTKFSAEMVVSMLLEKRLGTMLELLNQYIEIDIPKPNQTFPERRSSMISSANNPSSSSSAKSLRLINDHTTTNNNTDAQASMEILSGLDPHQVLKLNSTTTIDWRVPTVIFPQTDIGKKANSIENTELWTDYFKNVVMSSNFYKMGSHVVVSSKSNNNKINDGVIKWPHIAMLTFLNVSDGLSCMTTSTDASVAIGGFDDSRIMVWSSSNTSSSSSNDQFGRKSTTLIGHSGPIYGVSMTCDANAFVSASHDKTVRFWQNNNNNNWLCSYSYKLPDIVWSVHMAKYGYFFATGCRDRSVRLHHTNSSENLGIVREFVGHLSDVNCVEIHPNIHYITSGSDDKTARLWDVRSGSCVRVFVGHVDGISSVAVDRDGMHLASGGKDGEVKIWDIASGKFISTLKQAHSSMVTSMSWGQDFLITGSTDCSVSVWVKESILGMSPSPLLLPQSRKFTTKLTPIIYVNMIKPDVVVAGGSFSV